MGFIILFIVLLGTCAAVLYFKNVKLTKQAQIREILLKEISRTNKILGNVDALLQEVRGLSTRHDALFERYAGLRKEVQSTRKLAETGTSLKSESIKSITYRALTLKEQLEKEKERVFEGD